MAKSKTNKSKSVSSAKRTRRTRNIHSTYERLTPKQKLTLYLNDALAIENAAVQRLQSRIKQTKIENAKQRLQLHLQETREQQNRLKHL
ncbi:MAG: DUF892 family protein, partial [Candidatus Nitrosopolaris sp.]